VWHDPRGTADHIFITLAGKKEKENRKEVSTITLIFEGKDSYGAPVDITVDISTPAK